MVGPLGAHVSTAGGISRAPARGAKIGATAIQVFTKSPNRWQEPRLQEHEVALFKQGMAATEIQSVVSHDSYLINLASPDPKLRARSVAAFKRELERCRDLGIPAVVTHPGNFIDDRAAGIARNAAAYTESLEEVSGPHVFIETTAGSGTALGSTFQELAELRRQVRKRLQHRVGFCADTCHLHAAGYDIVNDWDGVWNEWDRVIGLNNLRCIHLNDSKTAFGSRRDRHELIGEGTLGPEPFRRMMRDQPFRGIMKVIETPKLDDPVLYDRRMIRRLRAYGRQKSA
ncbi:MAG: deoxyribonuclease IV [Gemmatimonadales bacterium]